MNQEALRISAATIELLLEATAVDRNSGWVFVLPSKQVLTPEHAAAYLAALPKPVSIVSTKHQGRLALVHYPSENEIAGAQGLSDAVASGQIDPAASFEICRDFTPVVTLNAGEMQRWDADYQFPLLITRIDRINSGEKDRFRVKLLDTSEFDGDVSFLNIG